MNNKFIKRVAAVVLGVAVLSTCAFAAPSITDNASYTLGTSNLYFELGSAEDKISYIAYASEDDNVDSSDKIIAIGQIDDSSENKTKALPISKTLLGNAKKIIIMSGDSSGETAAKKVIPAGEFFANVTLVNGGKEAVTVNGESYINAPEYTFSVEFNKAGSVVVNKLIANGTHEISGDNLSALSGITFASGATANVNFFLAGAPEAEIANGIALKADCTFTAN